MREVSSAGMRPVLFVVPPNEVVLDESFWKEAASAGAAGVAFSRLSLMDASGDPLQTYPPNHQRARPLALKAVGGAPAAMRPVPAFARDPGLYEGLPYCVPEVPDRVAPSSTSLKQAIAGARARGFEVHFNDDKGFFMKFPTPRLNLDSSYLTDPNVVKFLIARAVDTSMNFPEMSAVYLDGVNYKWEIKPGHPDDIWAEVLDDDNSRRFAYERGLSLQRVLDGRDRFQEMLHALTSAAVDDFIRNRSGAFGAIEWWLEEPDTVEWLRFKAAVIEWHLSTAFAGVKARRPSLKVGVMWRMPAIAWLTGYLPRRIRSCSDFQMPKEYWWAGGYAGQKGTVINWVDTLVEWNPGLSPDEAARWFSAAFDYPLTPGYSVSRYHEVPPESWYETAVADQTRKMIAACGGPEKTVPVVALEHTGTHLTAAELRGILRQMQSQGIKRYLWVTWNYVSDECLGVMTEFAG